MSAWQLVNAWSGFRADMVDRTLTLGLRAKADCRLPWSAGAAWGEIVRHHDRILLRVNGGRLPPMSLLLGDRTLPIPALGAGEEVEIVC
jgi:hypothetical protein